MTEPTQRPIFPKSIETKRLMIRPPMPGDGIEVNAAIRETYEELNRWMPWADHVPEIEETETSRVRAYANFLERIDCTVQAYLKETGEVAVFSGLNRGNPNIPSFEIGYWCRKRYQRQGYVTEVVRALTRVAFERMNARRVEIHCNAENEDSSRVAERAGFRKEAELRNHALACDGSVRTTLIFGMIPEEFVELCKSEPEKYDVSYEGQ